MTTDWKHRGAEDCIQDHSENTPFASVGGLDARSAMVAPRCAKGNEQEYLAGYREAAFGLYGEDWQTCEFRWQRVLTFDPSQRPP